MELFGSCDPQKLLSVEDPCYVGTGVLAVSQAVCKPSWRRPASCSCPPLSSVSYASPVLKSSSSPWPHAQPVFSAVLRLIFKIMVCRAGDHSADESFSSGDACLILSTHVVAKHLQLQLRASNASSDLYRLLHARGTHINAGTHIHINMF